MLTNCLGIVSLTENDSKLKSLTATRPLGAIPILEDIEQLILHFQTLLMQVLQMLEF